MNDYTWGLYLKAGGSRIVECFEAALGKGETDGYSEMICDLLESFCVDKNSAECVRKCIEELIPNWDKLENQEDIDISEADDIIDEYMDQLWSELMDANDDSEQKEFCGFINNIEILSTTAAIALGQTPLKHLNRRRTNDYGKRRSLYHDYHSGWSYQNR